MIFDRTINKRLCKGLYQVFTGSRSVVVTHPCSADSRIVGRGVRGTVWSKRARVGRMHLTRRAATQLPSRPGIARVVEGIATVTRILVATEMWPALPSTLFRPIQLPTAPAPYRIIKF